MSSHRRRKGFPWKMIAYVVGGLLALTLVLAVCLQGTIRDHFNQKKITALETELQQVVEWIAKLEADEAAEFERGEIIHTHQLRQEIERHSANKETLQEKIEALKK